MEKNQWQRNKNWIMMESEVNLTGGHVGVETGGDLDFVETELKRKVERYEKKVIFCGFLSIEFHKYIALHIIIIMIYSKKFN